MERKRLVGVVVVLALLLAAGAAGYRLAGGTGKAEADAETVPEEGPLLRVGEILTNLAGTNPPRFVQVAVELEVDSEKTLEHLEERMPEVRDEIIALLRATPYEELEGAEGMRRLGQRIAERVNERLKDGQVLNVYFTAFVVQ